MKCYNNELLRFFWHQRGTRLWSVTALLITSNISETLGIAALLPVLIIATKEQNNISENASELIQALQNIGIPFELGPLLLVVVIAILLKTILKYIAILETSYMSACISRDLRLQLVNALAKAKWSYFITHSTGKLTNSLSIEIEKCGHMISAQIHFIAAAIMAVLYFCMALWISWPITIVGLCIGIVSAFLLRHFIEMARNATEQQNTSMRNLSSSITEFINNYKPLKAMGFSQIAIPEMESQANHIAQQKRKEIKASSALQMTYEPLIAIFLGIGLYLSVTWFNIAIAELLFSAALFQRIMTNIGNLQSAYQKIMRTEPYLRNVLNTIAVACSETENIIGKQKPQLNTGIIFKNVSFSYADKPVLENVNLEIPAHKLTTFLGPSGSGKTTCIDLICALYMPNAGKILIDETDLKHISLQDWRNSIGYVPQEPMLYNQTIAYNLALSEELIHLKDVERALKLAGAWSFTQQKSETIYTKAGEKGLALSGGQRQRIALARALYRRPKLLILDEVTSALDPETEKDICQTLQTLKGKVTMLAISHRPALADISDQVITFSPTKTDLKYNAA